MDNKANTNNQQNILRAVEQSIASKRKELEIMLIASEGEITPEIDEKIKNLNEDSKKIIKWLLNKYIENKNWVEHYKEKKSSIDKKIKSKQTSANYFTEMIEFFMNKAEKEELIFDEGRIFFSNSSGIIADVESLADDYIRTKTIQEPDKVKLTRDIKNNIIPEKGPGYYLEKRRNLKIE